VAPAVYASRSQGQNTVAVYEEVSCQLARCGLLGCLRSTQFLCSSPPVLAHSLDRSSTDNPPAAAEWRVSILTSDVGVTLGGSAVFTPSFSYSIMMYKPDGTPVYSTPMVGPGTLGPSNRASSDTIDAHIPCATPEMEGYWGEWALSNVGCRMHTWSWL
jgi:hypothetical protein